GHAGLGSTRDLMRKKSYLSARKVDSGIDDQCQNPSDRTVFPYCRAPSAASETRILYWLPQSENDQKRTSRPRVRCNRPVTSWKRGGSQYEPPRIRSHPGIHSYSAPRRKEIDPWRPDGCNCFCRKASRPAPLATGPPPTTSAPAIHSPSPKDRASVRRQIAAESDASVPPERVKSRSSPVTETATPQAPNMPTSPALRAPVVPLNRSCGVPLLS